MHAVGGPRTGSLPKVRCLVGHNSGQPCSVMFTGCSNVGLVGSFASCEFIHTWKWKYLFMSQKLDAISAQTDSRMCCAISTLERYGFNVVMLIFSGPSEFILDTKLV